MIGRPLLAAALAAGLLALARDQLADRTGLLLQPELGIADIGLMIGGAVLAAALAAAFPAFRAMNADIEELLRS